MSFTVGLKRFTLFLAEANYDHLSLLSFLSILTLSQIWIAAFGYSPSSIILMHSKDFCFQLTTTCHWVWNQLMMFLYSKFYVNKCDTAHNWQQQTWLTTQTIKFVNSGWVLLFYPCFCHDNWSALLGLGLQQQLVKQVSLKLIKKRALKLLNNWSSATTFLLKYLFISLTNMGDLMERQVEEGKGLELSQLVWEFKHGRKS